jgi:anti-sigma regulatory factor (Ser/Thr protein kinase)
MPQLEKVFKVKARDFVHAGEVSLQIQSTLKGLGFDPALIRRVAVCAYESEMNVVMHGGDGKVFLTVDPDRVSMEIRDEGEGIDDIELALKEGFSTASEEHREMGFGAGMGLPNIKKNADRFDIQSEKGGGTTLRIAFFPEESP